MERRKKRKRREKMAKVKFSLLMVIKSVFLIVNFG
jgi:hypothetical protein